MAKQGLGRGLSALLGDNALSSPQPIAEKGERVQLIARAQIVPSPYQPRKHFKPEQITELATSIKEQGIIQPLIVRPVEGKYELIAGERRWRAAEAAGLATVPVIVRSASDREVLELALVENLQRADLNPLEEAEAYALLIHQFKLTQEQVAERVGRSRVSIANAVRLLSLPAELQGWVQNGQLSVGHAKVLLGLDTKEEQLKTAELVVRDHLTVRQTEKLVESLQTTRPRSTKKTSSKTVTEAAWTDLEKRLQQSVGTRVRISGSAETGKIEIQYFNADDLERLLKLLGVESW
jgi:ParB family chromosome partitioning protein